MTLMTTPQVTRLIIVLAALLFVPSSASAQDVSLPSLKAAFLANFPKFAEWPDDASPPGRMFTFCVAGDKAVADALEQAIKDRPGQEPTSVVFVTLESPLRGCQVLYLGGLSVKELRRTVEALTSMPIFTVSDVDGFAELGGVAQLRLEHGRMRFAINPAAAQRAHLALSAKLLSLATIVKDSQ
jgi:hypothetical protein